MSADKLYKRLCKRAAKAEKQQQSLRTPTPGQGAATKTYVGDVKDGYLRGLAGGEAHPFFDAGSRKRR
jgi:hypothetical protein